MEEVDFCFIYFIRLTYSEVAITNATKKQTGTYENNS